MLRNIEKYGQCVWIVEVVNEVFEKFRDDSKIL